MAKMNYKTITEDLIKNGVNGLSSWGKDEFVACCEIEYDISKRTALKVYRLYHELVDE